MLLAEPTRYGAGVTFYGDYYDLQGAHETIHRLVEHGPIKEATGDFILGLAYDADNKIVHQSHDARFVDDSPDTDIIQALSSDRPRPVLVTADEAMQRRPHERKALAASGLTVVFLHAGFSNVDRHTQAVKLLTIWPEVVKDTSRCKVPTAFEIGPAARKVQTICETKDL
jgi:hypothetical protein